MSSFRKIRLALAPFSGLVGGNHDIVFAAVKRTFLTDGFGPRAVSGPSSEAVGEVDPCPALCAPERMLGEVGIGQRFVRALTRGEPVALRRVDVAVFDPCSALPPRRSVCKNGRRSRREYGCVDQAAKAVMH